MIDQELLKNLVCPVGKKELGYVDNYLVCTYCGLKFPLIDDIPVMIVDEAILPPGMTSVTDLPCMKLNESIIRNRGREAETK